MKRHIRLPTGETHLEFDLASNRLLSLISPSQVSPAPDPSFEVERALKTPIGGNTVEELTPRKKSIAIAVDDITRSTPTHLLLSPLLNRLTQAGARKDRIKIFVALGTHRSMTDSEMKDKYGPELVEEYTFINHIFDDESQLHYLGTVVEKLPVWINKEFLEADIRIATGNIIPHFNAGWAGGAKTLLPGLAGEETVGKMHVHSAITTPNGLGIEVNPTRLLIDAFCERVKLHLLVNSVINRQKEITRVYAGHYIEAHRRGIPDAKRVYGVPISGLADITVSSSYPCDIEFWQGLKSLFSADRATKVDGGIVTVTPCPEGVSVMHPKWIEYLQYDTTELHEMYRTEEIEDLVAFGLALNVAHIREKHPICIVSHGITDKEAETMQFIKFDQIEEAIAALTRKYGVRSKINVLTHGGETYPI